MHLQFPSAFKFHEENCSSRGASLIQSLNWFTAIAVSKLHTASFTFSFPDSFLYQRDEGGHSFLQIECSLFGDNLVSTPEFQADLGDNFLSVTLPDTIVSFWQTIVSVSRWDNLRYLRFTLVFRLNRQNLYSFIVVMAFLPAAFESGLNMLRFPTTPVPN